jgi:Flp pilus assembly protein TadG
MIRSKIFRRLAEHNGQALIEFILLLPILFLLIVNLVNFGGFFYAWITVADAARAGADYAILGGAWVGGSELPSSSNISSTVQAALTSLPNAGNATITVCQRAISSTCTTNDSDPESANYYITEVDVSYTYTPFIPAFSFPKLGVYLTLPPTTVSQRAEMRSML